MVCKQINRINAKLEEMYDARFWFYTTIIQAPVFDGNNFCYRISQLTQLTSPERFDEMKYAKQREESLQQIVSTPRDESLPQIASGIYYQYAILQNLSEQDICFDSIDYINTRFYRKNYNFFPQNATFFRKLNSALFDRSRSGSEAVRDHVPVQA